MAEASSPHSERPRFEALDGLRGVAALLVVLAHFCSATGVLTQHLPGLFNAVLAVDTFFVLSGFVLAHSFLGREHRGLPLAPISLLAQRWVRLWFPFAAATILGAVLRFGLGPLPCANQGALVLDYCRRWNTPESVSSIAKELILFYSPNLNAPSWTLPIELLNSFLVPALVLLLARSKVYLLGIAGMSLLSIILPIRLPDCLYLFAAGCALRCGLLPQDPGRWALKLITASYLLMLPNLGLNQNIQQVLMTPAAIALVLVAQKHSGITALLCHPLPQWLGKLSFPIYLLHWPVLLSLVPRFHAAVAAEGMSHALIIDFDLGAYLLSTVLLALPFEEIIDARAIRWGRSLRATIHF